MNRLNKILIIILIIIAVFGFLFVNTMRKNLLESDNNVKQYEEISKDIIDLLSIKCSSLTPNKSLEKDNLKVTLKGFYLEPPDSREKFIKEIEIEDRINDVRKATDQSTGEVRDEIDDFLKNPLNAINAIIEFRGINDKLSDEVDVSYRIFDL